MNGSSTAEQGVAEPPSSDNVPPEGKLWPGALLTSLLTGGLFVILYPLCNELAAMRDDVGQWYWQWEMYIPLVPFMIIPYMSIDLFFVASPFLCTSRREIWVLGWRLAAAILIASLFFVLFPLQVAFPRDPVEGIFGPLFEFLWSFDKPYNAFPSLHIALAFILRWTYHKHIRGWWRWLFHIWFALISVSTLLTHQHQMIDTFGGLLLAIFVSFAIRSDVAAPVQQRSRSATRMAMRLGAAAAALAALAGVILVLGPVYAPTGWGAWMSAGWLLLWPVLATAIVALGYGLGYPGIFRKADGELPFTSRIVLAPYLLGLHMARRWFWSNEPAPFCEVTPGLWIGRLPSSEQAKQWRQQVGAKGAGAASVLDMTAEHNLPKELRDLHWLNIPTLDLSPPHPEQLAEAVRFVKQQITRGPMLVFCGLGYGRSAAVVMAYLLAAGIETDVDAAFSRLRCVRPGAVLRADVRLILADHAAKAAAMTGAPGEAVSHPAVSEAQL